MKLTISNIVYYIIGAAIIITFSYVVTNFKEKINTNNDYIMIQKYLLNDSPLYGHNRPKLWIHTKYEINSRKWKDFYSRNTTDLNQPYIHLTIKTIIDHCGDDFNICLIDDETFSKLIPTWDIDLNKMAEPMKSHFRQIGMAHLLYSYGGMIVPNSFICIQNMKSLYEENIANGKPFVSEIVNNTLNLHYQKRRLTFIPDMYFMGAERENPIILELIKYLEKINSDQHLSSESDFVGEVSNWLLMGIQHNRLNLLDGEIIGVKTRDQKAILLENLMEEEHLKISSHCVGIYIPADEILSRPKYQWFAVMPSEEVLKTNMIVSKYLLTSILDNTCEYNKKTEIKSVVSL
jgi:hypothetical protein